MMIAATHNPQRKAQHVSAATLCCGMGRAAPIADGYKFQFPSVRSGRPPRGFLLPLRGNCGVRRGSAFFFTPRSIDPDELHELRICELTGRQPCLSRALDTGHHAFHSLSDVPKSQSASPFVESRSNDLEHETKGVGSAQDSVGVFQYVGC